MPKTTMWTRSKHSEFVGGVDEAVLNTVCSVCLAFGLGTDDSIFEKCRLGDWEVSCRSGPLTRDSWSVRLPPPYSESLKLFCPLVHFRDGLVLPVAPRKQGKERSQPSQFQGHRFNWHRGSCLFWWGAG